MGIGMDIHNTSEDIVFNTVQTIFEEIEKKGNPEKFCLCEQCKTDIICYTLNRIEPHYIVSNRGFTRVELAGMKRQQTEADVATLVYKAIKLVNHNMRPTSSHDGTTTSKIKFNTPLFDVPTIAGRIFDGESFEPVIDIDIALFLDGELVPMRNNNWQNPFTLVSHTPGAFSFWPAPIPAEAIDISKEFKFSVKVNHPKYEVLNHFFTITILSHYHSPDSHALNRKFKLPDLYLFRPGSDED